MAKSVKQPVEKPFYLKQVRVRDYAPVNDVKAVFKPGLNIIIGSNGSGKTRFTSFVSRLVNLYNEHNEGVECEIILGGPHEINIIFEEPEASAAALDKLEYYSEGNEPSLRIKASSGLKSIITSTIDDAIMGLSDNISYDYFVVLIPHGIPFRKLPIVDENAEIILGKRMSLNIGGEVRKYNDIQSRFVNAVFSTILRAIRRKASVNGVALVSLTLQEVKGVVSQTVDTYLNRFNETLPSYSPIAEVRLNELFQVYENSAQDEFILKGLVLEYKVSNRWLPFSALSDGTKRLFYLISELLSPVAVSLDREGEKFNAYDGPKIIFLEEPELGIHPEQLHKLLSLIREVSREHQVIMTTHSPQVLDMLSEKELDRITICELDPKKGTQFRKLSRTKQAEARAYMREQLHLSDFWRYADLEAKD